MNETEHKQIELYYNELNIKRVLNVRIRGNNIRIEISNYGYPNYSSIAGYLELNNSKKKCLFEFDNYNQSPLNSLTPIEGVIKEVLRRFVYNINTLHSNSEITVRTQTPTYLSDGLDLRHVVFPKDLKPLPMSYKASKVLLSEHSSIKSLNIASIVQFPRQGRGNVVEMYYGYAKVRSLRVGQVLTVKQRTVSKEYVVIKTGENCCALYPNIEVPNMYHINPLLKSDLIKYVIDEETLYCAWDALFACNRVGMRRKYLNVVEKS